MKSEYLYGIVVIVVLLIILFVYNMMSSAPSSNSGNQGTGTPLPPPVTSGTGPTTFIVSITGNSIPTNPSTGILTVSVNNSKTVTNTMTASSSVTNPMVALGDFSTVPAAGYTVGGVQYDGSNYLNLYEFLNTTSNQSRLAIAQASSYGVTITDTSNSQVIYDATTASVSGNVLTFTSGTNTLTITFTNSFK